jgi:hypothetical protein
MNIIRESLLWNDIIESDGKFVKQETLGRALLEGLILVAALCVLYWLISLL